LRRSCPFYFNLALATVRYGGKKNFNWEAPLTELVWITSIVSIVVCFIATKLLLGDSRRLRRGPTETLVGLSAIVSCGTLASALIMEFTKIFVSTSSRHVSEVTNASGHGGRR